MGIDMLPRTKEVIRILLSGGGGAAAIGAIKSLRKTEFGIKVVAIDSDPLSAGFHLAHGFHVVPHANSGLFMTEFIKIAIRENIHLIIPTSGDLIHLAQNKKVLNDLGITCFFSDFPAIDLCNNKYKFYREIKGKFPAPKFTLNKGEIKEYPVFVKPIRGKGSRDSYLCESRADVEYVMSKHRNMIICEYLPGKEYTIDVLSDMGGKTICAIPRERIETKAGISSKGRIRRNKKIERLCKRLAEYIGLKGPSCMQMKQDRKGRWKFIEVNPRLGGGTIITTLAGVNIPRLILKLYSGKPINKDDLKTRDIVVTRYLEEITLSE